MPLPMALATEIQTRVGRLVPFSGVQSLYPAQFEELVRQIRTIATVLGQTV